MSIIYLKVNVETLLKLQITAFKKFVTGSVFGSSNSCRFHWVLKLLLATEKSDVWEQNYVQLFYYFKLERSYDDLKSKSPCILLNKNINFNKNEMEWKMENPTQFYRDKPCASAHIRIYNIPSYIAYNIAYNIPYIAQCKHFFTCFLDYIFINLQKSKNCLAN